MVQCHRDESSNKLKILQMVWIHVARRIDLETVIVLVGILKETIHRIQNFMGQQEKPLSRHATIVQALLAPENNVQTPSQLVGRQTHDLVVRILEQCLSSQSNLDVGR